MSACEKSNLRANDSIMSQGIILALRASYREVASISEADLFRPNTLLQLAAASFLLVLALGGMEIIPAISEIVGAPLFIVGMALLGVALVSLLLAGMVAVWNVAHRASTAAPAQPKRVLRHAH